MAKFSRSQLATFIAESEDVNQNTVTEIAALLIEENRTHELESLMRDVMEIRATKFGVVELTAFSASPLSSENIQEIEKIAKKIYPSAKQVVIHEEIDESMIGGARLKFANASLDLSILSRLNKLKDAVA